MMALMTWPVQENREDERAIAKESQLTFICFHLVVVSNAVVPPFSRSFPPSLLDPYSRR